jgi:glycosyltransferase involved in cell wall biosynthesis
VTDLEVGRRIYGLAGLRGLGELLKVTRRFRPDVIHGYLFGPNLFAVAAGRLAGVPVVAVAKRNVDAFETPRQLLLQKLIHRTATHVTAVSAAVADTVVALGVPKSRVTVIPNGVDVGRFPEPIGSRRAAPGTAGIPVIGSVGCLAPRKDYATLLEALAELQARGRAFRAMLVGDGPERTTLESRARALGLEGRIEFLGEREDVENLLACMDVFVLSSREEGIPNALLEAMAAGCPAVATAVGGTPEVLEPGVTGWLVPPGSPRALADALGQVLDDPEEASRRGTAARRRVEDSMSIDAMARRHEEFYQRALQDLRR